MDCPIDGTEMKPQQGDGIAYNECPQCHGMFLRHRALRTLAEADSTTSLMALPRPFETGNIFARLNGDTNEIATCPKCGGNFTEFTYGTVRIDMCQQCDGIWLDAGELENIKADLAKETTSEKIGELLGKLFAPFSRFSDEDK